MECFAVLWYFLLIFEKFVLYSRTLERSSKDFSEGQLQEYSPSPPQNYALDPPLISINAICISIKINLWSCDWKGNINVMWHISNIYRCRLSTKSAIAICKSICLRPVRSSHSKPSKPNKIATIGQKKFRSNVKNFESNKYNCDDWSKKIRSNAKIEVIQSKSRKLNVRKIWVTFKYLNQKMIWKFYNFQSHDNVNLGDSISDSLWNYSTDDIRKWSP